jgi:hypothetical protein
LPLLHQRLCLLPWYHQQERSLRQESNLRFLLTKEAFCH